MFRFPTDCQAGYPTQGKVRREKLPPLDLIHCNSVLMFTLTNTHGDKRNDQHENVEQGDFAIRYKLTDVIELTTGFQYSCRKESFENALQNYNTSVGIQFNF